MGWRIKKRVGGGLVRKLETEVRVIFLSHCCGEKDRESESAEDRDQKRDRDGEAE